MNVTTVIVNYKTPELTEAAFLSFRRFYPEVDVILCDNGSGDGSYERFHKLQNRDVHIPWVLGAHSNRGHGPMLDHAICAYVTTDFVFTLDSDTITHKGAFLEQMLSAFAHNKDLYAIGWLRNVNASGVSIGATVFDSAHHCPYVHPAASVYDLKKYFTLPPFNHEGAPANKNMWAAKGKRYQVASFPIWEHISHLVAGTRRMYQGRWNPRDGEIPDEWNPDAQFPI